MIDQEPITTIHDISAKKWAGLIAASLVCLAIIGWLGYEIYQLCIMACAVGAHGW